MKKLISVLLCLCMLGSFLPAMAFADGVEVVLSGSSFEYTGSPITPGVTVYVNGSPVTEGSDYTVSYANNVEVGTGKVIITGIGNYVGHTREASFTITPKAEPEVPEPPVDNVSIELSGSSFEYTGSPITPGVAVYVSGSPVTEGTDYTVGYANNVEVGTAKVIITGIGNFAGHTREASFTITPKTEPEPPVDNVTIELSGYSFEYTGSPITPGVAVYVNGSSVTEGTDYTVGYENNIEVGTAKVIITGIGNYAGHTREASFTITPKTEPEVPEPPVDTVTIELSGYSFEYTGSAIEPEVTSVKVSGVAVTEGTDYTVSYANNIEVGTGKVIITGIGVYVGHTREVSFTITPKAEPEAPVDNVTIELSGYSFEYTGSAIEPEVTSVKVSGVAVTEGTDYTVSYANNIEVGTAKVIITGIGNYAGHTREVSFTITPKTEPEAPVDNVSIELSGYSFEYTGSAIEPEVTSVKVSGVAVTEGTDYTVSYANNIEVGTAKVIITGIGNYAGHTREVSFTITPKTEPEPPADPVDPVTVTLSGDSFEYTGSEIKPTVSVLNGTNTLTEGIHFEVEYSDNINAGEATVTVRGLGDAYSGHVRTAKFEITKRAVTVTAADQTITKGEDIEAGAFSVTNLVEGHVPTASLLPSTTDVTDNGTITPTGISISAAGVDVTSNYAITPVAGKLIINPAAPGGLVEGNLRISLEKYSYSYTGSEIKPKVTVVLDGKTLAEGKDYDVFYTDNVNVGKATVTLVGKGDFENESRRLNFNITPRVITPQIALSGYSFVFNNRAHRPAVTVYDGNRALSSSEYIVGYKDNVNIGIATVTVRDAEGGNYVLKETGATFRIVSHIPYRIIYGNGSGWIRNASYCLTFACNGDYANFRGIFVDGMRVDPAYYSSSSGSTVVTLYPNLLRLLGNGWHYLTFEYVDGYATAVFYVGPPSINAPVTGDDSSLGLLSAVMALGIMGSVSALVLLRRKKNRS